MACCQEELKGKLVGEVEVKSSATVFHLFVFRPHLLANVCPSSIQGCHVEQGEFGKNGSLIVWNYKCDGKLSVAKEILENVDAVNKSITYRCVQGDIKNVYKTFLFHLRVKPQANKCNDIVEWTLEYEKLNEGVDPPTTLLDLLIDMTKKADAHFLSNPTQIE